MKRDPAGLGAGPWLRDRAPQMHRWLRAVFRALRPLVRWLDVRFLLSKIVFHCDLVLMDVRYLRSPRLRHVAKRLARSTGELAAALQSLNRIPAVRLTGPRWTVVFVGRDTREARHLFFEGEVDTQSLGNLALWQLPKRLEAWLAAEDIDLVVYERPQRMFRQAPSARMKFTVPAWVDQTITLPESPQDLFPTKRKRTYINACLKAGCAYELTRCPIQFDAFYTDLYTPYVTARHDGRLFLTPHPQLKRLFQRGGLLRVTLDDTTVAGKVIYRTRDTLYSADFGVLRGGPKYWKQGGIATLDWHSILWAYEEGISQFNFGGTRGWYSDGVYQYKRAWKAKTTKRSRIHSQWTIMARRCSSELQAYLNDIGFITEADDKFYGVHLRDDADEITTAFLDDHLCKMKKQGLDGLALVTPLEIKLYDVATMPRSAA